MVERFALDGTQRDEIWTTYGSISAMAVDETGKTTNRVSVEGKNSLIY